MIRRNIFLICFMILTFISINACDNLEKKKESKSTKINKTEENTTASKVENKFDGNKTQETETPKKEEKAEIQDERFPLLKQRVDEFWASKVKGDRGIQYEMQDPFFRSHISKESYISMGVEIIYENPQILDITIEGNVAKVKVGFVYYGEIMGRLKPVKIEKTYAETVQIWLYLDNQWYLEYYDNINEFKFANY